MEPKDGRVLYRQGPFPGEIIALEYLENARFMLVAAGVQGLMLLDKQLKKVWRAIHEGERHIQLAQGPGNLVAAATDARRLELLEGGARTSLGALTLADGRVPGAIAVSPAGSAIAIGYVDEPEIDVRALPSGTLPRTLRADALVAGGGDLSCIAWAGTADGLNAIYGGGTLKHRDRNVVVA